MVYSKSEIMEYASYAGELAKLNTGLDLIIESSMLYLEECDDDAYEEGVKDVFLALRNKIVTPFNKIEAFARKKSDQLDNLVHSKKYQAMMSPEMKAKFDEINAGKKIEGPDIVALKKALQESEKFINKFVATVNSELEKLAKNPSYDASKIADYCDKCEKLYDARMENIEKIVSTKKTLSKNDFFAMVKAGVDINTDVKAFQKTIDDSRKKFLDTLEKFQSVNYTKEAADDGTDDKPSVEKPKTALQKAVSTTNNFLNKHANACFLACTGLSIYLGKSAHKVNGDIKYRRGMRDAVYKASTKEFRNTTDAAFNAMQKGSIDPLTFDKISKNARFVDKSITDAFDAKTQKLRKESRLKTGGAVAAGLAANHFRKVGLENKRKKEEQETKQKSEED